MSSARCCSVLHSSSAHCPGVCSAAHKAFRSPTEHNSQFHCFDACSTPTSRLMSLISKKVNLCSAGGELVSLELLQPGPNRSGNDAARCSRPVLRILSGHQPGQQNPDRSRQYKKAEIERGGREGEREGGGCPAGQRPRDSPVGVRALVNDVLIGGEQGQSVLSEIQSHV